MKIIERFSVNNDCYKNNVNKEDSRYTNFQENGPQGFMLHSVGCAQSSALVFANAWNKSNYEVAVHAVLQADGTVYQCLPWNYRGWHCGSGSNGSYNNSYVGVEMTEPDCIKYTQRAQFTCSNLTEARAQVQGTYKTAVELFAFLCKTYNRDPLTCIVSHNEGRLQGMASGHVDPEHLWKGLGLSYTMDGFRKDVKAAMGTVTNVTPTPTPATQPAATKQLYRVRKSWKDAASQKGAFSNLDGAVKCCKEAGSAYHVYDSEGKVVYPKPLEVGDEVKLAQGAKYINGQSIPSWVINSTLYVREIRADGNIVFSTLKTGAVTGVSEPKYFQGAVANTSSSTNSTPVAFEPYVVSVDTDVLNVRKGPGTNYAVVMTINRGGAYTIVEEKNGFGLLKSGAGWICLDYTKKR